VFSIESIVRVIVYLIVAGLILYLLHWLVGYVNLPEPFAKVARIVLAVAGVLILIGVLLSIAGHPVVRW
jgi:uncharacterized protein YhhL (DUF1145 family)